MLLNCIQSIISFHKYLPVDTGDINLQVCILIKLLN